MNNRVAHNQSVSWFDVYEDLRPTEDHEAESVSTYALEQGARTEVKRCERQILLLTPNVLDHWRQVIGALRARHKSYHCTKCDKDRPAASEAIC